MHGFHAPPLANELRGQPVQQLRVRRRRTHPSEIVGCLHNSFSKMMLPDAIDHHPRGQRICVARQPLCQGKSASGGLGLRRRFWEDDLPAGCAQHQWRPRLHRRSFAQCATPMQEIAVGRSAVRIGNRHGRRQSRRLGFFQLGDLLFQFLGFLPVLRAQGRHEFGLGDPNRGNNL